MDQTDRPLVSAIILDYAKGARVVENVRGLQRQSVDFPLEIIVADNSCDPENARHLERIRGVPNVHLIINPINLGYTKGCNRAAAAARGRYILIVNPDISWPDPNAVKTLVKHLEENRDIGIIGPRQIEEGSGAIAMTVRRFPNLLVQVARRTALRRLPGLAGLVARDEACDLDKNLTQHVDWLQSSCVLIRRDLWDAVGGFDERYRLFMADPEICWRAWTLGYKVTYHPQARVGADGRRLSRGGLADFFRKWTLRQHVLDALIYQIRHIGRGNPRR
jgi:GT2 family glycosyltransferase